MAEYNEKTNYWETQLDHDSTIHVQSDDNPVADLMFV